MEVILLLLGELMKWIGSIPMEFFLTVILVLIAYLVKRINQMQNNFTDEISGVRREQAALKEEYLHSAEELKAVITKLSIDLGQELENQKEGLAKNYLLALRTAVVNDSFPKSYRLEKYDEYHKLGGNTFVDEYVKNVLLKEREEE